MKFLAAMAALLLVVWFVLKMALPAFRALFHLLADVLPFLLAAAVASALAVVVFKRAARFIRRPRPVSAFVARPATAMTSGRADPAGLAGQPANPAKVRPATAPPPSPELWILPPPKASDMKADSGSAGGDPRGSAWLIAG